MCLIIWYHCIGLDTLLLLMPKGVAEGVTEGVTEGVPEGVPEGVAEP